LIGVRMLLAAAAVVCIATAAPAQAQDERPCVSKTEYHGLKSGQTRAQVEARWEVEGAGIDPVRGANRHFLTYPLCGFALSDASVTVGYANDGRDWWKSELLTLVIGSTPHGHEAHP
jgi:hypothetical protein